LKLSDLLAERLVNLGIDTVFAVTGGASMHLNDSFGENGGVKVVYMHHEQACAMAAEGYARTTNRPAVVLTTAGPGAINTLNGVFGAFTDSIPMIVIAGQAKSETLRNSYDLNGLRQLGDQEAQMIEMVSGITKDCFQFSKEINGLEFLSKVDQLFNCAVSGRPGPVWLEFPVDVQALQLEILESEISKPTLIGRELIDVDQQVMNKFISMLNKSKRPVMLLGTGVRLSGVDKIAVKIAENLGIPVMTAWTHDVIKSDHPNFVGRPGTIGTRPGNFITQQCDLLLVLGSRLNIRQISYNWDSFAKNAQIIQVDVDPAELQKPFPKIELGVLADLKTFIAELLQALKNNEIAPKKLEWLKWCKDVQKEFEVKSSDYEEKIDAINAYHLIPHVIDTANENSIIVCGDATACIVPFQTAKIRDGMRMFSNSGSASMGFDLPAAIGASQGSTNKIICFAGDGSVMMNLQELQTLAHLGADIKLFILDNGGYLSIKQTQENFFGRKHGSEVNSGLTFPDFTRVCEAFGLLAITLDPQGWRKQVEESLSIKGPVVLVAHLNREQEFEPRLKSRVIGGEITTPDLDDMFPHLDPLVLSRVRNSVKEALGSIA
jgi:acetolactate synthase I/II/III large subunit